MLDIRWMRENRQALAEAMVKLNDQEAPWELALELDGRRRELLQRGERLREERNTGSKQIGRALPREEGGRGQRVEGEHERNWRGNRTDR